MLLKKHQTHVIDHVIGQTIDEIHLYFTNNLSQYGPVVAYLNPTNEEENDGYRKIYHLQSIRHGTNFSYRDLSFYEYYFKGEKYGIELSTDYISYNNG